MDVCAVDGCSKPERSWGWCNTHYFRWYRTGDVGSAEIAHKNPGATCKHPDCAGTDRKATALGYCHMHYTRIQRHGDPDVVKQPKPLWGAANPTWIGDDVGYRGAHDRVRARRGGAAAHACEHCPAAAKQWAYDRADPDELTATDGPYSAKPEHYIPLCVPCHKRFDLSHVRQAVPCKVEDCDRKVKARGMCDMHYLRARGRLGSSDVGE